MRVSLLLVDDDDDEESLEELRNEQSPVATDSHSEKMDDSSLRVSDEVDDVIGDARR